MYPFMANRTVGQLWASVDRAVRLHWISLARVTWLVTVVAGISLFIAGIPVMHDELRQPCDGAQCFPWQSSFQSFEANGPSPDTYARFYITLEAVMLCVWIGTSAILVRRAGREGLAIVTAIMLVAFGTTGASSTIAAVQLSDPRWYWPVTLLSGAGTITLLVVFFVFPDGKFAPAWSKFAAVLWVIVCVVAYGVPLSSPLNQANRPFVLVAALFAALVVVAQVGRYRHLATADQRSQIRIVIRGLAWSIGGLVFGMFVVGGIAHVLFPTMIIWRMIALTIGYGMLFLTPLSIAYAVLRRRLWTSDALATRLIVYSIMSLFVIGTYVTIVTGVGSLVSGQAGWLSLLATGIVAITIQPVREACQRVVERLFFGQRAEPYAVVSHLGDQLEGVGAHEAAVTAIVDTVAQALKLPFVEITLELRDGSSFVAQRGQATVIDDSWPLMHQQEQLGTLAVSPRSRDERLSASDRQLLTDIARQAGTVLGAIRVTEELRHSHARLVSAREEERRRLHRDLHDGLAPNLASQSLTLDAARTLMHTSPETAANLFDSLGLHLQASMEEVRRIIYGLRPSALDNLGLAGALSACGRVRHGDAAAIDVDTHGLPHPLPAAVEVAAYWITREAITNMDRHSQATQCTIRATVNAEETQFSLEIDDNGRGISAAALPGVGLASMRERARELGGTCTIEEPRTGGTRVQAMLPLRWVTT